METETTVRQCICERCGHKWLPKKEGTPTQCPKCTNPYWNKPKIVKSSEAVPNGNL